MARTATCFLLATATATAQLIFMPQNNFQVVSGQAPSLPIDLEHIYDNRAFGLKPNETDFDGSGGESRVKHFTISSAYDFTRFIPCSIYPTIQLHL